MPTFPFRRSSRPPALAVDTPFGNPDYDREIAATRKYLKAEQQSFDRRTPQGRKTMIDILSLAFKLADMASDATRDSKDQGEVMAAAAVARRVSLGALALSRLVLGEVKSHGKGSHIIESRLGDIFRDGQWRIAEHMLVEVRPEDGAFTLYMYPDPAAVLAGPRDDGSQPAEAGWHQEVKSDQTASNLFLNVETARQPSGEIVAPSGDDGLVFIPPDIPDFRSEAFQRDMIGMTPYLASSASPSSSQARLN